MRKKITEEEKLMLAGLFYIMEQTQKKMNDCEIAIYEMLKEAPDDDMYCDVTSWFVDAILDGSSFDAALRNAKISVKPKKRKSK